MSSDIKLSEKVDPVSFEVLRNFFRVLCNEASSYINRVAYNPILTEGGDLTISLLTSRGELVSHGDKDLAAHFGPAESKIKAVLSHIDDIKPKDVYIINDPFLGGTHVCDVGFVRPIFYGDELLFFGLAVCHWPDIGGPVIGSFNPRATELYAEGLRFPPLKIYEDDRPQRSIFKIIEYNVRCYFNLIGDISAQYGSLLLMERRLEQYLKKFGKDTVMAVVEELFDYSEKRFRQEVSRLEDGTYECVDYGDRDVMHPEMPRIKVHAKLTIKGDQPTFDFSGSSPTPKMSWGFARPALLGATYDGTMHCFPFLGPLNHGIIRAIDVISKPGTCVDVQEPAPTTGYASGAYEKVDTAVIGCWAQPLAKVDPRHIQAGTMNLANLVFGGVHPKTKLPFVCYSFVEGGGGARTYKDGVNHTVMLYACGAQNELAEPLERWYPIVHTRCEVVQDSCGDGKFRGGFAMSRNFRAWGELNLCLHADRGEVTPMGWGGGTNGGPVELILNEGSPGERVLGVHAVGVVVKPGDHITFCGNGGGGYGDPLERDPKMVLEDVIDGYISLKKAAEVYGVAIRAIDEEILHYEIDLGQTARLRGELSKKAIQKGVGPWEVNPSGERIKA